VVFTIVIGKSNSKKPILQLSYERSDEYNAPKKKVKHEFEGEKKRKKGG